MSEHAKNRKKLKMSKKATPRRVDNPDFPVEVIVYDCVQHERCIAEYRNENKWWYSTRLHKVYHPNFKETLTEKQALEGEMGYRWVSKIHKVLGSFDPNEVPAFAS